MAYSTTNSRGQKYWLHRTLGKNKRYIYFFSKNPEGSIDLPDGFLVGESPISGIPVLKKR